MIFGGELLVAVLLLGAILWKYFKANPLFEKLKHWPGPKPHFLFGNALDFQETAAFLPTLYKYFQAHGDIFLVWIGPFFGNFIVADEKLAATILCSTKNLTKAWQYKFLRNWLGNGLLVSEPERWRQSRKLVTPAFHFQILEKYVPQFEAPTSVLINKLRTKVELASFDIYHLINLCSLDIMSETSMGTTVNAQEDESSEYVRAVKEVGRIVMERAFSATKQFNFLYKFSKDCYKEKRALKILHDFTGSMIKQRRREMENLQRKTTNFEEEFYRREKLTFMDILLLSKSDGEPLSDQFIRDEVDTFLFEGHDTTTSAISFALHSLANHPEVQNKAIEEQYELFGKNENPKIRLNDLQNMKYLDLVIKESLRLYPSVPIYGRYLTEDIVVDGQVYPSGYSYIIFAYGLQRNPKYFSNPDEFIPTRFIDSQYTFSHVPFSAGPRNCIGQKFAMLEAKYVISSILRNFELLPATPNEKLVLAAETILKSLNGIKISIRERS